MKGKALLVTLLMLVLCGTAYWGYTVFSNKDVRDVWSLVPSSAVGVYRMPICEGCVDSVVQSPLYTFMKTGSTSKVVDDSLFMGVPAGIRKSVQLISLHRTTHTQFDFVLYLSAAGVETAWNEMEKQSLKKKTKLKISSRTLNGFTIHETGVGNKMLTWVDIDKIRVMSFTAILIEDVIRTSLSENKESFKNEVKGVFQLPTVKNDGGDVFIKTNEFIHAMTLFTDSKQNESFLLGDVSVLDVKGSSESLVLNGFTNIDSTSKRSLLTIFQDQTPVPFKFKNFISNDAQFVVSLGISDGALLGKRLSDLRKEGSSDSLFAALKLSKADVVKLYASLGNELDVMSLESSTDKDSKVLLLDASDIDYWHSAMVRISDQTKTDTVFHEEFSGYVIEKMEAPGFLAELFPTIAPDFSEMYFVCSGTALFMAEDIRSLKKLLEDIDQDNTWGKYVDKNRFLESTLLESTVSFYVDPSKANKLFQGILNTDWKNYLTQNKLLVKQFGISSFQFSHLNENFYTHINLTFAKGKFVKRSKEHSTDVVVNLSSGIYTRPFVVKNHNDKRFELLVQDSAFVFYLLGRSGETLWQKKLDGLIKGDVKQIDYFGNGKLQYLLTTGKTLYIIDRLGNMVDSYPKSLAFDAAQLNVVDYDHSKKYRFLFADKKNVVRMMSKEGELLEGWRNVQSGGELSVMPRHYRVTAKDYVTMLTKEGVFTLFSRRGEVVKNFPVQLKGRAKGDFYLSAGDKESKPHFVFILNDGYRVKVGLDGKELSRETLIKSSQEMQFKLVNEVNEKSYCIVRQDLKQVVVLSPELQEVFTNDYVGLSSVVVSYYDFGSGNEFYSLVDIEQNLGYIYNREGKLLNEQPIECSSLSLIWDQNRLKVASAFGNALHVRLLE